MSAGYTRCNFDLLTACKQVAMQSTSFSYPRAFAYPSAFDIVQVRPWIPTEQLDIFPIKWLDNVPYLMQYTA